MVAWTPPQNDLYVLTRPVKITKFLEVYIKDAVEQGVGRRVKHIVTTVPKPFRGKTSGPPCVYVWWYNGDGQYYYEEDLNVLLEKMKN
jgi:hypothetical protein